MNLVVQASSLDRKDVAQIASLAKAAAVEKIAAGTFRLRSAKQEEAMAAYCEARRATG